MERLNPFVQTDVKECVGQRQRVFQRRDNHVVHPLLWLKIAPPPRFAQLARLGATTGADGFSCYAANRNKGPAA
eukprot:5325101-Pyramimonas_sp.AAC.1